jgi:hypothetical protein
VRAAAAAAVLLLAACAHTDVTDMGQGRYSLTADAPSGGFSGSHEAAIERANDFCGQQGRAAVTDGFYDHSVLAADGTHSSTILFRCAARQALKF